MCVDSVRYDENCFTIWNVAIDAYVFAKFRSVLQKAPGSRYRRLKFEIDLNDRASQVFERALRAVKPEEQMQFKLNFEGVRAERPVDFFFEVYLNLPDNTPEPNYTMESYAGNLTFFGAEQTHAKHGEKEELKFNVNVTGAVKRLRNLQRQNAVSITLVPTALVSRDNKRLPIRSDARISVEQVTLSVGERER